MNTLNEILLNEIPSLKEFGTKFLNKEITKGDFKGFSGGFGVYAHRDGQHFMIRLRVSSGVLSVDKLTTIYELAKKYNLEKIHLTTRQAIQFHGLSIEDICNVMKDALEHNIYTRGGGGNFPRNVALSPLSGVDKEEAFDVAPYSIAVDNHFINKIYTYKLPRKLKVSFSNSLKDSAHCTVQDLGFVAIKKDNKNYFKVFLGGGLGRNPALAVEFDELIEPKEVLYHVEAMTNLFINEGDYKNKGKARIRYIVERLGKEGFLNEYKKYLKLEKEKGNLDLNVTNFDYEKEGIETNLKHNRLFSQKQKGLYSVYFHPIGGQLYLKDLKILLDELKNIPKVMIRSTMTEGIYILNLNGKEAEHILKITENLGGETKLEQSISCIGVPVCQMGVLDSQEVLTSIITYFRNKNFKEDILPKIHISGCPNSCGTHEIGSIGLVGKKKKVNEQLIDVVELHLGGKVTVGESKLGNNYGDIPKNKIPELLYELALECSNNNIDFSTFMNNNENKLKEIVEKYTV